MRFGDVGIGEIFFPIGGESWVSDISDGVAVPVFWVLDREP